MLAQAIWDPSSHKHSGRHHGGVGTRDAYPVVFLPSVDHQGVQRGRTDARLHRDDL